MVNIEIKKGDITQMKVDAVVNAANPSLMGGGGVDGAIHRAGGSEILEACKEIVRNRGKCNTGEAVITTGGKLKAKFVIHTVGPVWNGGNSGESEKLADAYKNSIQLAERKGLKSIAFPNISTGVYGFPKQKAAEIALETVKRAKTDHIETVYFVCFDDENYRIYKSLQ